MRLYRFLVILSGLLVQGSPVWASPAQILIIRHAEKPFQGNELNAKGLQRAQALVQFFTSRPSVTEHGAPIAIFAAAPGSSGGSIRSMQTVQPLADHLGMKLHTYTKSQTQEMVNLILSSPQFDGKTVLICFSHGNIAEIAQMAGAVSAPRSWDGAVFDRVWKVDLNVTGQVTRFQDIPENVLPGDSQT